VAPTVLASFAMATERLRGRLNSRAPLALGQRKDFAATGSSSAGTLRHTRGGKPRAVGSAPASEGARILRYSECRLDARGVVEELAEADGEDEVAEKGVIDAGQEERAGMLVGEGEQESADDAESHGKPVAEDDVNEAEGKGAREKHGPAGTEERSITMTKEGAVEQFLGINGEKWIEEHDQGPKGWGAFHEGKKKLGSEETNGETQEEQKDSIAKEES
jgi:hypothetical protein